MIDEKDVPKPAERPLAQSQESADARAVAEARINGDPPPDGSGNDGGGGGSGCLRVLMWLVGAVVVFFFLLLGTCALMMK